MCEQMRCSIGKHICDILLLKSFSCVDSFPSKPCMDIPRCEVVRCGTMRCMLSPGSFRMPESHHGHVCLSRPMRRTYGEANQTIHGTDPSSLQGVITHMLTAALGGAILVKRCMHAAKKNVRQAVAMHTQVQLRGVC